MRDPDGYYIEFCNCAGLEEFLQRKMAAMEEERWDLKKTMSLAKARKVFKKKANVSKTEVAGRKATINGFDMADVRKAIVQAAKVMMTLHFRLKV